MDGFFDFFKSNLVDFVLVLCIADFLVGVYQGFTA